MTYIFGSSGCNLASSPIEEVGRAPVFEAAFDGEQGVGSGLRPVASGPLESAAGDLLAGTFQRKVLRCLLVRQSWQLRHRLWVAELRVLCLACHDSLFRSCPNARRPPFAGLRKPPRDRPMLNPDAPDCNPPKRRQSDRRRKRKTDFTQKYKPHP